MRCLIFIVSQAIIDQTVKLVPGSNWTNNFFSGGRFFVYSKSNYFELFIQMEV